ARSHSPMPINCCSPPTALPPFPTRRSSDLDPEPGGSSGGRAQRPGSDRDDADDDGCREGVPGLVEEQVGEPAAARGQGGELRLRSEEHTSELQSRENLVCRLLLEKKKETNT